jgi:hypothetical protein
MDQHARAADGDAQGDGGTSIPTTRQAVVRTVPAAILTVIGIPVIAWLLLDPTGEMTTRWLPVLIIALMGLAALVHHLLQAPRPHVDKRISTQEVKDALAYTRRSGTLPTDPRVRTATAVFACSDVETIMWVEAFCGGGGLTVLIL